MNKANHHKQLLTILALGAFAVTAIAGFAVPQGNHEADHFALISKELKLTAEQQKALMSEHEAARKKLAAIDANTSLSAVAKANAKEQVHREMMAKAQAILSPAQMKKLTTLQQHAGSHDQIKSILKQLDLTPEQEASVHKIMQDTMTAMHSVQSNSKLSSAEKDAQSKQLHAAAMQKVHALLSPAQLEKAKALLASEQHGSH